MSHANNAGEPPRWHPQQQDWQHFHDPRRDPQVGGPSGWYPQPGPPTAPFPGRESSTYGTVPGARQTHPHWPPPGPPVPPRRRGSRVGKVIKAAFGFVAIMGFFAGCVALLADREPVRAPTTAAGAAAPTAEASQSDSPQDGTSASGTPQDGEIVEAGTLSPTDLQPGDCFTIHVVERPGVPRGFNTVEAVPCSTPHEDQLVTKVTYAPTDNRSDVVADRANRDCDPASKKLTTKALRDPSISQHVIYPATDEAWKASPVVACTVHSKTPITRSLLK